ncbi:MAG: hypothetical protein LBC51_08840 [Treponema sp.]|jgi:hypothetical protein|nr:hypothetical protein [Treponema sp.]
MKKITLKKVENAYKKWLEKNVNNGQLSNVDEIINVSLILFQEIKVKGIAGDAEDGDMLLFQYGLYDWGKGRFFEFDITRQFIKQNEDEPYQLSMTLLFEPTNCESYNCWSNDFDELEQWVKNIKETEGYKLAKNLMFKKFEISFEQC